MENLPDIVQGEMEARASVAQDLHEQIVSRVQAIRREWIYLGGTLFEFFRIEGWRALGYDSKEQWLASPEIDIGRTQAFRLVEGYRELVIERGVKVEQLAALESSKVWEVLPAVRRGQVEVERALADCEVLGQMDLRERYSQIGATSRTGEKPIEPDDFHYETCPTCGSRIRVSDN